MTYTRITGIVTIDPQSRGEGDPPRLWMCDDKDNFTSVYITAENAAQLRRALDALYPPVESDSDHLDAALMAYAATHENDRMTNPL